MIHMFNISKFYENRCVLNIPDYTFETGKSYAILGENGSGKSTLLRVLMKVISPECGTIDSDIDESIGYLPQFPYIFNMSVRKNVKLALINTNKSFFTSFLKNKDIDKIIDEKLKSVNLSDLSEANAQTLSGGEKQRLAIARVIAKPHNVVILDEPTSATDIAGIDLIENAISEYVKKNNSTLIFSTHSPAQAIRLSNEVIFLNKGRIIDKGNSKDVLINSKNEYIKKFLSYSNL